MAACDVEAFDQHFRVPRVGFNICDNVDQAVQACSGCSFLCRGDDRLPYGRESSRRSVVGVVGRNGQGYLCVRHT